MTSRWICAALGLALSLSLAGCGAQTAGTDASRWNQREQVQNNARYQRDLADGTGFEDDSGTEKKDWAYRADDRGQVDGYHSKSADRDTGESADRRDGTVENDLKDAGSDLKDAVRDAARSVGDTAEDAMDGMKDAARDATESTRQAKR